MTKDVAITIINKNLNKNLNSNNTNWSNINANGLWSMEPNLIRKNETLYLILNNNLTKKLHVFEISSNNEVYNKLYVRDDKSVFRLLFNVNDKQFTERLKFINFNKFHIGSFGY